MQLARMMPGMMPLGKAIACDRAPRSEKDMLMR